MQPPMAAAGVEPVDGRRSWVDVEDVRQVPNRVAAYRERECSLTDGRVLAARQNKRRDVENHRKRSDP